MTTYPNLDQSAAFRRLTALPPPRLSALLQAPRLAACDIAMGGGLVYNWAASPIDAAQFAALRDLGRELGLIDRYRALASGAVANTGEGRMVLHHLARGQVAGPVIARGKDGSEKNLRDFYELERARFSAFAEAVRAGVIRSPAGKPFTTAVQIGIGGSDLGPRALYLALERWARAEGRMKLRARFISNVDPDDTAAQLASIDLDSSLFILVSKSGTTQETLANESLVRARLRAAGLDPAKQMLAVTSETSPLARSPEYLDSFYIDDFIGGRYSSSSAVGGVLLSLAFGPETFEQLLAGAHEADLAALEPELDRNASLMDALVGLYERNVLGMGATAVLPYSEPLSRFPAHLQQLDMESNGKSVNLRGEALSYRTGPVVFGEPGTNGQHSFFQLLHQGSDIIPLQFIGFTEGQCDEDLVVEGSTSRVKLNANLAAQIVAFAMGSSNEDPNKRFAGERPSTLIRGVRLDPRALGALLAHYENKVMFQGFAWNLNSFDQEGVQLGKVLTKALLRGSADPLLAAYAEMLGLRGTKA